MILKIFLYNINLMALKMLDGWFVHQINLSSSSDIVNF